MKYIISATGSSRKALTTVSSLGRVTASGSSVTKSQPPSEFRLSADHAIVNAEIGIYGTGFGNTVGSSTVTFGERPNSKGWASCARTATVVSWSNTYIVVRVPSMSPGKAGATNTYHPVYLTIGGVLSSSLNFYVTPVTTRTGQSYTSKQDLSSTHDVLYDGCSFSSSSSGNAAVIFSGGGYNVTFHNCTFASSAWNGLSINELSNSNIRDITVSDCTFGYCYRMNFECTGRSSTTISYQRIALIGSTFNHSGSENVSFDGYDFPSYCLVKNCLIKGAGMNTAFDTDFQPHCFEINGGLNFTVQNLTTGQPRAFCLNLQSNDYSYYVFENCTFDRGHVYTGQTYSPRTNSRVALLSNTGVDRSYWLNCIFNGGTVSFNLMHLENCNYNVFENCQYLGSEPSVSYYGSCTGNTGLPN